MKTFVITPRNLMAVALSDPGEFAGGMFGAAVYGTADGAVTDDEDAPYRYMLLRTWGGPPTMNLIGLNPSTATAHKNDPTIGRCVRFAKRWGYRSLIMTNLYAFRATKPSALIGVEDPIGVHNNDAVLGAVGQADLVVAAWGGAYEGAHVRSRELWRLIREKMPTKPVHILKLNKDGQPGHPLYLPGETEPFVWGGPGED
jgi:hypothetical protein